MRSGLGLVIGYTALKGLGWMAGLGWLFLGSPSLILAMYMAETPGSDPVHRALVTAFRVWGATHFAVCLSFGASRSWGRRLAAGLYALHVLFDVVLVLACFVVVVMAAEGGGGEVLFMVLLLLILPIILLVLDILSLRYLLGRPGRAH